MRYFRVRRGEMSTVKYDVVIARSNIRRFMPVY